MLSSRLFRIGILVVLLAFFSLLLAAPALAREAGSMGAASGPTATVASNVLNVRAGPGTDYNILTVLYYGQVVEAIGRNSANTWVKIQIWGGVQGWVSAPLVYLNVAIGSLPILDGSPPAPPPAPAGPTAVVASGALNVRSGPGVSYSILTKVYNGTPMAAIGRNSANTWLKVRLSGGQEGWVSAALVYLNVAIGSLPVADAPPAPAPTAIVSSGELNVRSGPGTGYGVLAILRNGDSVTLLARNSSTTWVKIRTAAGVEGWVNVAHLYANLAIPYLPVVDVPTLYQTATVASGALNVRYGPGTGYGIMTVLSGGQIVEMIGRTANSTWVQVRLPNGWTGWVSAALITPHMPIGALPVTW
jgi:N-acetylmuramoyl-L-alanine amidase